MMNVASSWPMGVNAIGDANRCLAQLPFLQKVTS